MNLAENLLVVSFNYSKKGYIFRFLSPAAV